MLFVPLSPDHLLPVATLHLRILTPAPLLLQLDACFGTARLIPLLHQTLLHLLLPDWFPTGTGRADHSVTFPGYEQLMTSD